MQSNRLHGKVWVAGRLSFAYVAEARDVAQRTHSQRAQHNVVVKLSHEAEPSPTGDHDCLSGIRSRERSGDERPEEGPRSFQGLRARRPVPCDDGQQTDAPRTVSKCYLCNAWNLEGAS